MRGFLAGLLMMAVGSGGPAVTDPNGSLDLDLSLRVEAPAQALIGTEYDLRLVITNEPTSQGPAYALSAVVELPSSLTVVSSSLGPVLRTEAGAPGTSRVVFEGTRALGIGDTRTETVRVRVSSAVAAGGAMDVAAWAYGEDSPFDRGAAPAGSPPGTPFGGVDLSSPTSTEAQTSAPLADDAPQALPTGAASLPSAMASRASTRLILFRLDSTPLVAEGERASGLTVNAFSTRLRLTGNGVGAVSAITVEEVLPTSRAFLGWESLPVGASGVALANTPDAGRTTLRVTVPALNINQTLDAVYRSGIPEFHLADSATPATSPAAVSIADEGTSLTLVLDGTASTTTANATAATYAGASVASALLPANVNASVQVEYVAVQLGLSPSTLQIGDHTTATLNVQVSEYLDLVAPATFDVTMPDGLTFDGGATVASTLGVGAWDATSGIANANGDTLVRYRLADGERLLAGASGAITFTSIVDNTFEGSGELFFEAASSLRATASAGATIADNGSTESTILGATTADDSAASVRAPSPTMELRLLSVRTADGTLYNAGSSPAYSAGTIIGTGSELEFALVARFPRVPTLGVAIDNALPLIAGPNSLAYDFRFVTDAAPRDINNVSLDFNDSDGDGAPDAFFGDHATLGTAASFPTLGLPNALAFDIGNAEPDARFVVAFKANVRDIKPETLTANGLIPYRNTSLGTFGDESGKTVDTFTSSIDFTVAMPSVTLDWAKVAGPNNPMAGDTVTMQATLDNNGFVSAFLDPLAVTLPADWTYVVGSAEIVDATGVRLTQLSNVTASSSTKWNLPLSDSARAILPADDTATPAVDESVVRVRLQATLKQSVYPGQSFSASVTDNYYSVPSGGQNFGPLSKSLSLSVPAIAVLKELIATSESFTTTTNLAIGEVATYRLTATLPQATLTNLRLVDQLPDVMELLAVRIISVDAGLQLPTPTIANTDTRNNDGYRDRAQITWGNGTNVIDGSGLAKKIVVEVDARVKYAAANRNGNRPANTATLYERSTTKTSTHTSTIREPLLATTITHAPTTVDAHDTVTFTVTVTHASGSATSAYDTTTSVVLPEGLEFVSASSIRTTGSFVAPVPTISGAATAGSPLQVSSYTLAQNTTLAFDVTARVAPTTTSRQQLAATTTTRWTTLPGASSEERVSTVSATDIVTLRSAAVTLVLNATNLDHTAGTTVTIGEIVDATLEVRPAEGVARSATMTVTLSAGLAPIAILGSTMEGGLERTGTDSPAINGQAIVWPLGDVTNTAQSNAYAERFTISVRCVATNVAANATATSLPITGRFAHDATNEDASPLTIAIAEPRLTLDQYVLTQPSPSNGNALVLGLSVNAAAGSLTAFEPVLRVKLPAGVVANGPITSLSGAAPVVATLPDGTIDITTPSLGGTGLVWNLAVPAQLVAPAANDRLESVSILTWTGQPGTPSLAIDGTATTGERTGATTDPGGDANTYRSRNVTPTAPGYILAFEDLRGDQFNDFDFNDMAMRVAPVEASNAQGQLTGLTITFEPLARGASFDHRFELDLNIVGGAQVTVRRFDNTGFERAVENTTSSASPIRGIKVYHSTQYELPGWGGADRGFAANTVAAQAESQRLLAGRTIVEVQVLDPALNPMFHDDPATAYLDERMTQLYGFGIVLRHSDQRIRHAWTLDAGTRDIVTSTAHAGTPLLGYPIAQSLLVPAVWEYPTERTAIWSSHPLFVDHIKSGATRGATWYTEQVNASGVWPTLRDLTPTTLSRRTSSEKVRTSGTPWVAPIVGSPSAGVVAPGQVAVVVGLYTGEIGVAPTNGGSPYLINTPPTSDSMSSPIVVDLDGDGIAEIVRGFDSGDLRAWRADGTELLLANGAVRHLNGTIKATPAAVDIDSDGRVELIVQTGAGLLYVLESDLSVRAGFPVALGGPVDEGGHTLLVPSPAVANLGEGRGWAIVAVNLAGRVALVDANGQAKAGWPVDLATPVQASPAVADLDLDGTPEVVVATESGEVIALRAGASGPTELWRARRVLGGVSSPLVANIDATTSAEVIVGSLDGKLYAYDATGAELSGWPVATGASITASPCAIDVDADGVLEVLVGNDAGMLTQVDNGVATTMTTTGAMMLTGLALADANGDGTLDLYFASHAGALGHMAIALPTEAGSLAWSGLRGNAANTGAVAPMSLVGGGFSGFAIY